MGPSLTITSAPSLMSMCEHLRSCVRAFGHFCGWKGGRRAHRHAHTHKHIHMCTNPSMQVATPHHCDTLRCFPSMVTERRAVVSIFTWYLEQAEGGVSVDGWAGQVGGWGCV